MATLRNKTTSEGVIVLWTPFPDHGRPSTYQVTREAVSFLADLGFEVPNPGDEVEIPWEICRPLRVLGDLYFKSDSPGNIKTDEIGSVGQDFAQDLTESQRRRLREYISTHRNYPDERDSLSGEMSSLPSSNSDSDHSNSTNIEDLQEGDKLSIEIDRISSSGNGIIETNQGHINIGPVKRDAEEKEVKVEIISKSFAICLTESARRENYIADFWKVDRDVFYKYGKKPIKSAALCINCGSASLRQGDNWKCGTCGTTFTEKDIENSKSDANPIENDLPDPGEKIEKISLSMDSRGNICSASDKRIKINGIVNLREIVNVKVQTQRDGYVVATIVDRIKNTDDEKSIDQLREKAINAATDDVTSDKDSSISTTTTYSRSQEIKDYVKARAEGKCEACTEPAPFISKTGEPYLHVHHIHELSEGGSDTPDTVTALCPNCHYRVHHGQDGESFNQNILNKIQLIEDDKE